MEAELSLIKFGTINYFSLLLNSRPFYPITTLLVKIVKSLIRAEEEHNEEMERKLNWIITHTHKEVNENLAIIELAVFKNLDRGLNREIEINNKTFYLTELYKYLDEITTELTEMVIDICKKYSLEIPITSSLHQQTIKVE